MELATADDGNEPIYVRQYSGVFTTSVRTLTLLDSSGNTSIPGALNVTKDITAPAFHGIADYATYDTTERGKTNKQDIANKYIHTITTKVDTANKKLISTYGDGTTAQIDLENLEQIGGRNLWINSSVFSKEANAFTRTSNSADGVNTIFNKGVYIYSDFKFTGNEIITVQGKSNAIWTSTHGGSSTNKNRVGYWLYFCATLEDAKKANYKYSVLLPGDNASTTFKYTLKHGHPDAPYLAFRFNTYSNGTETFTYKLWGLKLELGNEATDWTPAPEDLAYLNSSPTFTGDLNAPNVYATTFHGALDGNSATATKLKTARAFQTNLASDSANNFDGSANCTMGVTGILPVKHGGTGATTAAAAKANIGLGNVANIDQSKAIKSITRSGTTFTATALDGTKTTFDQQDNNTTYNDATTSSHGLMSAVDKSKLDGIASGATKNVSTVKSFTLSASNWSSGVYTISDSLITASSNQEVLPATTITADQMKALQKANIIDSGQSAGSLTLKALGTVPTIDIPIRVIFRGTI